MELLKTQLARQDWVDNAIFQLMQDINPSDTEIDWNIELIGTIRDSIQQIFVGDLKICNEQDFYPFIPFK